MRSFLRLMTRYPMASVLVIALTGFLGAYASLHMPIDLFPDLDVPVVNIISHYPGAGPEDIEFLLSRPIEDEMRSIQGVKRVASTSLQGISQVTVEFSWGVGIRDARQLIQSRLGQLVGVLPTGIRPRIENIGTTLQEVCSYVVYGAGDPVTLRNTVRHDIAGRLMGVPGVSSVEVLGGDRRAFNITLHPEALARTHLSLVAVIAALKKNNTMAVAGFLERSGREYLIRGDARFKTLEDLRSLPLKAKGREPVLLGSIADIHEGRAPRHYVVRGDGVPAVALLVRKQPGASTTTVVSGIEKAFLSLRRLLPPGTKVKKFYDQSEIILESQHEILQDLLLGALLTVLVLYFFLGSLRPTLIVAVNIPLTLLATIALMRFFGLSFNVITMTALALAIGMIVDDAIVVAENIHRHALLTSDPQAASIDGLLEIAAPVASGTFTTVAAFLPLLLATGIAALFLRPFGLTISFALLISLVLSFTLVPLLSSRGSARLPQDGKFTGAGLLRLLEVGLRSVLRFSFRNKGWTLALAFLSLGLAGSAAFLSKVSVLPPIDEGAVLIEYIMPPGTSLRESNRIGEELDHIALKDPDVSCVYRRNGSPEIGYQIEGVNKGTLLIKLKPKGVRYRTVEDIMASFKKAYSRMNGMVFLYHQPTQEKIDESFSGLPALFGVTIYGPDSNTLISLAGQVEGILSKEPGVHHVVNNSKVKAPQIEVHLDRAALARFGIAPEEVLLTLQAARFGVEATRIVRQKEDVAVMVKLDAKESWDRDLESLEGLPVSHGRETPIPLNRLADIQVRHIPAAITRLNGQREITLVAEVEGNIPAIVAGLRKKFQTLHLPQGYSLAFTGQYKILIETAVEMLLAVAAAVALIYLFLTMQFRSWRQPLVILATVPLALVGAFVALLLTGQGLDVSVGMGLVTLVGIVVNNAIVLMDYANHKSASGCGFEDSLCEAASFRLRPILLTTFTTIAALLPTAFRTSVGSRIFQPFAITVIGGLFMALWATLVIIPTFASALIPKKAADLPS